MLQNHFDGSEEMQHLSKDCQFGKLINLEKLNLNPPVSLGEPKKTVGPSPQLYYFILHGPPLNHVSKHGYSIHTAKYSLIWN